MIALALLLALAGAPQAKPAAKAPAKAAPAGARPQISMNISPAGQAIMKKYLGGPDAEMVSLAKQLQGVALATKGLGAADKLDMAKLQQLLRQQEQLQAQLRKRSDDRLVAMLTEMSEADRLGFARGTVAVTAQSRPAPSR